MLNVCLVELSVVKASLKVLIFLLIKHWTVGSEVPRLYSVCVVMLGKQWMRRADYYLYIITLQDNTR